MSPRKIITAAFIVSFSLCFISSCNSTKTHLQRHNNNKGNTAQHVKSESNPLLRFGWFFVPYIYIPSPPPDKKPEMTNTLYERFHNATEIIVYDIGDAKKICSSKELDKTFYPARMDPVRLMMLPQNWPMPKTNTDVLIQKAPFDPDLFKVLIRLAEHRKGYFHPKEVGSVAIAKFPDGSEVQMLFGNMYSVFRIGDQEGYYSLSHDSAASSLWRKELHDRINRDIFMKNRPPIFNPDPANDKN